MRRAPRLGLLALVGLLAAGLASTLFAPRARAAPEQVYLALGDSIAAGLVTSLPSSRGYPWLVRDLIERANAADGEAAPVTLINRAVPGETVQSFLDGEQLRQATADIQAAQARGAEVRVVTITLGGNDLLRLSGLGTAERQAGLEAFSSDYPALLAAVRAALGSATPEIVVTTYYDLSEGDPSLEGSDAWWVAQFNQVIRQSADAAGAKVADLEPAFRGHIGDWTWHPTDVHPNNAGHAEIARLVWQALGFDTAPPVVTIERPGSGTLARRTPTIYVTADDNIGVTAVRLSVDGEYVSDLLYVPARQAFIGVWDGRDAPGPTVTFVVEASDLAGHTTTAEVTASLPGQ